MLFGQRVKTITHIAKLPNFVQDRIRMHWGTQLPESLNNPAVELPDFVGDDELYTCHSGRRGLTALPRDMFTDLYAATATLWKVDVTASKV